MSGEESSADSWKNVTCEVYLFIQDAGAINVVDRFRSTCVDFC